MEVKTFTIGLYNKEVNMITTSYSNYDQSFQDMVKRDFSTRYNDMIKSLQNLK